MTKRTGSSAQRKEEPASPRTAAPALEGLGIGTGLTSTLRIDRRDQHLKAMFAAQLGREMAQRQALLERSHGTDHPE